MHYLEGIVASFLFWLINGLHNCSDTAFVMRVFSIVSIQVSDSLLGHVFVFDPILHEIAHILHIHELHIV
jgi:hypothetical protein